MKTIRRSYSWDSLKGIAETHPMMAGLDVDSALTEYKRYLALKLIEKDSTSEEFAPSPDVDKVWHLHLVNPEQVCVLSVRRSFLFHPKHTNGFFCLKKSILTTWLNISPQPYTYSTSRMCLLLPNS